MSPPPDAAALLAARRSTAVDGARIGPREAKATKPTHRDNRKAFTTITSSILRGRLALLGPAVKASRRPGNLRDSTRVDKAGLVVNVLSPLHPRVCRSVEPASRCAHKYEIRNPDAKTWRGPTLVPTRLYFKNGKYGLDRAGSGKRIRPRETLRRQR